MCTKHVGPLLMTARLAIATLNVFVCVQVFAVQNFILVDSDQFIQTDPRSD
jgi:hypothetical protein